MKKAIQYNRLDYITYEKLSLELEKEELNKVILSSENKKQIKQLMEVERKLRELSLSEVEKSSLSTFYDW